MRSRSDFARSSPYWMRRLGVASWLLLGMLLTVSVLVSAVVAVRGLVIPLVVAIILGLLCEPIVDALTRLRLPRTVAAILTLLLIIAVGVGVLTVVILGIVDQSGEIGRQLSNGWRAIQDWWTGLELSPGDVTWGQTTLEDNLPSIGQGLAGFVGTVFSSAAAFFVGVFFGVFVLYFMLKDGRTLRGWLGGHMGVEPDVGSAILTDAARSLRAYFKGTALVAAITALIVMVPLVVMDVPLVGAILLLYFFSSFIPYVGAFLAGAFAVIIAFGSGGVETAVVILIAVIISNCSIQTALNSWLVGASLRLHPLVILLATSVAGAVGGVIAMTLAAPLTAIAVDTVRRLRGAGMFEEDEPEPAGSAGLVPVPQREEP
jgi:predicted PurR-regulated permease PerM